MRYVLALLFVIIAVTAYAQFGDPRQNPYVPSTPALIHPLGIVVASENFELERQIREQLATATTDLEVLRINNQRTEEAQRRLMQFLIYQANTHPEDLRRFGLAILREPGGSLP
jgi:hypothetical protein